MPFLVVVVCLYLWTGGGHLSNNKPVTIHIKEGMSADSITTLLDQQGVFHSPGLLRMILYSQQSQHSLQAGTYVILPHLDIQELIFLLTTGQVAQEEFTVPEGFTVNQIAELIQSKGLGNAEKFKKAAREPALRTYMKNNSKEEYPVEGYLFPDTYRIARGTSETSILKIMLDNFDAKVRPFLSAQINNRNLTDLEIITLASLVEKEAKYKEEKPMIAQVFLNRLQKQMPLQSCATIQYILGYAKPSLSIQDTQLISPYNTYLHYGLPPGPIANPGMDSIQAVLHPESSRYLYFVADREGHHHFSQTYEEHLAAIEKYEP